MFLFLVKVLIGATNDVAVIRSLRECEWCVEYLESEINFIGHTQSTDKRDSLQHTSHIYRIRDR